MRGRDIVLLTVLTALAPALGQAAPQSAPSTPDFAGVWTHPYWPGFDPPLSGTPGIVNRSRTRSGTGNSNQLAGDYTNPILKPAAAEIVRRLGEISKSGVTYPTPANQCWPQPVPYILWSIGVQLLQERDRITILYSHPSHESREVRLNQQHPANVKPSLYGDSIGHYEGDMLVVDTVGVRNTRPYAMTDIYGTPFSEGIHVVERYRFVDDETARQSDARTLTENVLIPANDSGLIVDKDYKGKALLLEFTVEDESMLNKPWSASMIYRRASGPWTESICSENTHQYYSGDNAAVPAAESPDF